MKIEKSNKSVKNEEQNNNNAIVIEQSADDKYAAQLALALAEIEAEDAAIETLEEKKLSRKLKKSNALSTNYRAVLTDARVLTQSYLIEAALLDAERSVSAIAELVDCSRERVLQHLSHLKREKHVSKIELNASRTKIVELAFN